MPGPVQGPRARLLDHFNFTNIDFGFGVAPASSNTSEVDGSLGNATSSNSSQFPLVTRFTVVTSAVPELASLTLLGLGVTGLIGYVRRRRRAKAAA